MEFSGRRIGQIRPVRLTKGKDLLAEKEAEDRRLYGLAPAHWEAKPRLPPNRKGEPHSNRKALQYTLVVELLLFGPVLMGAIAGYIIYGIPEESTPAQMKEPVPHHHSWLRHRRHHETLPHGGQ